LATGHGHEFHVEARVLPLPPEEELNRQLGYLYDYLDERPHPNFWVALRVRSRGITDPRLRRLRDHVHAWLDSLDPDEVAPGLSEQVPDREWLFVIDAIPKSAEARARTSERLIGISPAFASRFQVADWILNGLKDKAPAQYGQLDRPYLIAMSPHTGLAHDHEVAQALLGPGVVRVRSGQVTAAEPSRQPDGFFMGRGGPQNTRVAGVLLAWSAVPWSVGGTQPQLWLNPWTTFPLGAPLPTWERRLIDPTTGVVVPQPYGFDPRVFFGLPPNWPGFERP
jgi:hypothetical protein